MKSSLHHAFGRQSDGVVRRDRDHYRAHVLVDFRVRQLEQRGIAGLQVHAATPERRDQSKEKAGEDGDPAREEKDPAVQGRFGREGETQNVHDPEEAPDSQDRNPHPSHSPEDGQNRAFGEKLEEDPHWFDREDAEPFKQVHEGP